MTSRSAAASTVSGSENWETYTDGSDVEDEPDARDAYYARMRANKRGTPEGGYDAPAQSLGAGKRAKGYGGGLRTVGSPQRQMIVEEATTGVEGSEAGWTDDGDIGDTF